MALLPGSPAIDAGNNALIPVGVTTDQRGLSRIVDRVVDIGAFESSGFTITVTSGSGQSAGVLTAFPAPLSVMVTAKNPSEPVAGGLVTFTRPLSGPSATLSGSPATISATGTASVKATANGIVGSYFILATASGSAPASFRLTNDPLIIALDPSAVGALSLSGNASINTPGIVYVDSSSSSALTASGSAQVRAAAINVHGGVQQSGNASLSPAPVMGAPVLAVASLPSPSTTGMTNHGSFSLSGNSSQTIQPGIYSQISVSGSARLTMSSGIYIIAGGGFFVAGTASVTGSGVMIFNAGSNYPGHGGTYGSITLGGNATLDLSPATSGTYAGIVFFQPLNNTNALTVSGNTSGITGTIYAPAARLSESGHGALDASLIVDTLTISGNAVADSLTLVATSGVVSLIATTTDLSVPSAARGEPLFLQLEHCSHGPGPRPGRSEHDRRRRLMGQQRLRRPEPQPDPGGARLIVRHTKEGHRAIPGLIDRLFVPHCPARRPGNGVLREGKGVVTDVKQAFPDSLSAIRGRPHGVSRHLSWPWRSLGGMLAFESMECRGGHASRGYLANTLKPKLSMLILCVA